MTKIRTGRSRAIRAFLAANPKSTPRQVKAAFPDDKPRSILENLHKMAKRGILLRSNGRYSLGRELVYEPCVTEAERAERKRAKQKPRYRQKALDIVPVRAPVDRRPSGTVEAFLAAGGQIERLPTTEAPIAYGRRAA